MDEKSKDGFNKELTVLEQIPETLPISVYLKLIKWMKIEEINKEDLAQACQIFLLINAGTLTKSI